MNQSVSQIHHVVVTPTKSVGISLLLTFLFGPVGMLYSTVWGALLMIVLSVIVGFFTLGLGLILMWPIAMVWGALAAASWNRKVLAMVSKRSGVAPVAAHSA